MEWLKMLDIAAFQLINGEWVHPFLDVFFRTITDFSHFEIPLLVLIPLVFWKSSPEFRKWIILTVLTVLMADLVGNGIKHFVDRPRPYTVLLDARPMGISWKSASFSFPSNHAVNMGAVSVMMIWYFRTTFWALLFLIPPVFIAYSRVYSGVHYPTDVIGGLFIGAVIAGLMIFQNHRWPMIKRTEEGRYVPGWSGLLIMSVAFASVFRIVFLSRDVYPLTPSEILSLYNYQVGLIPLKFDGIEHSPFLERMPAMFMGLVSILLFPYLLYKKGVQLPFIFLATVLYLTLPAIFIPQVIVSPSWLMAPCLLIILLAAHPLGGRMSYRNGIVFYTSFFLLMDHPIVLFTLCAMLAYAEGKSPAIDRKKPSPWYIFALLSLAFLAGRTDMKREIPLNFLADPVWIPLLLGLISVYALAWSMRSSDSKPTPVELNFSAFLILFWIISLFLPIRNASGALEAGTILLLVAWAQVISDRYKTPYAMPRSKQVLVAGAAVISVVSLLSYYEANTAAKILRSIDGQERIVKASAYPNFPHDGWDRLVNFLRKKKKEEPELATGIVWVPGIEEKIVLEYHHPFFEGEFRVGAPKWITSGSQEYVIVRGKVLTPEDYEDSATLRVLRVYPEKKGKIAQDRFREYSMIVVGRPVIASSLPIRIDAVP